MTSRATFVGMLGASGCLSALAVRPRIRGVSPRNVRDA